MTKEKWSLPHGIGKLFKKEVFTRSFKKNVLHPLLHTDCKNFLIWQFYINCNITLFGDVFSLFLSYYMGLSIYLSLLLSFLHGFLKKVSSIFVAIIVERKKYLDIFINLHNATSFI